MICRLWPHPERPMDVIRLGRLELLIKHNPLGLALCKYNPKTYSWRCIWTLGG